MNTETRRRLARQSFEERIRKAGQVIALSATMKSSRVRKEAPITPHFSRTNSNAAKTSVESKL